MEILVKGLQANLPDSTRSTQVFALGQQPNPRKVKRTINMFLLFWLLAQGRKELGEVIKPTRLAKIVVLQHSYRDLYIILTLFPRYLGELEAYFREHEKRNGMNAPADADGGNREKPPDHLKTFVTDDNLRRLLTLHPYQGQENEDANFTVWRDGKCHPIPEEEVRAYIRLTRSITTDQKKVRTARSGSIFINRQAQLEVFLRMLDASSQQHFLVVTGPAGIGKTALLQQYAEECSRRNISFAHVHWSSDRNQDVIDVMRMIRDAFSYENFGEFNEAINSEGVGLGRIAQTFSGGLARTALNNKIVIFFDGYDYAPEFLKNWLVREFLFSIERLSNVIVCVSSRNRLDIVSSRVSIQTVEVTLSPFTKWDIADYLKALDLPVTDGAVEVLQRISEGNPAKFAQAAQLLNDWS